VGGHWRATAYVIVKSNRHLVEVWKPSVDILFGCVRWCDVTDYTCSTIQPNSRRRRRRRLGPLLFLAMSQKPEVAIYLWRWESGGHRSNICWDILAAVWYQCWRWWSITWHVSPLFLAGSVACDWTIDVGKRYRVIVNNIHTCLKIVLKRTHIVYFGGSGGIRTHAPEETGNIALPVSCSISERYQAEIFYFVPHWMCYLYIMAYIINYWCF